MSLIAEYSILILTTSPFVSATQSAPLLPVKSVAVMVLVLMTLPLPRYHVIFPHSFCLRESALLSPVPLATIAKLPPSSVFLAIPRVLIVGGR